MADVRFHSLDEIKESFAGAQQRGLTTLSCEEVVNAAMAFNQAAQLLAAAYNRLPQEFHDLNYFKSDPALYNKWSPVLELLDLSNGSLIEEKPLNNSDFWPRLSHNRSRRNDQYFPLSQWQKQTRKLKRDAGRLNKAIDTVNPSSPAGGLSRGTEMIKNYWNNRQMNFNSAVSEETSLQYDAHRRAKRELRGSRTVSYHSERKLRQIEEAVWRIERPKRGIPNPVGLGASLPPVGIRIR